MRTDLSAASAAASAAAHELSERWTTGRRCSCAAPETIFSATPLPTPAPRTPDTA
ncbi:hypothetical protein OG762_19140 [Streptomyces sp. NBC_01136]|uniref:hypothetical protein n=1 Tax=unclassified Streptomyces TaxID=2593676 RepID=UPI003250C71C|nr:hypothetical protein OG762_19140 [Streptomyces sp. NBC_01136]